MEVNREFCGSHLAKPEILFVSSGHTTLRLPFKVHVRLTKAVITVTYMDYS